MAALLSIVRRTGRKMTFSRRKAVALGGGVLALFVVILVGAPLLLRGRIDAWLQQALSDRLYANVSWERAGLSLIRDFPNASLRVDDLNVVGQDRFAEDTLAAVPRLSVEVELTSLLGALRRDRPLVVRSVEVQRPAIRLLVLEDGAKNWDIVRPVDEAEPSDSSMELTLRGVEVQGARVALENRQAGLGVRVVGLDESLRGDFRQERFSVESSTAADSVSLDFAGVPYLTNANLDATTTLEVDRTTGAVTVQTGEIRLNDLVLAVNGSVRMGEEATDLDLAFEAPGESIRELVSLVTPLYTQGDLSRAETSGTMSLSGWVRGPYGADAFPALELRARVEGGSLRYPELPIPVRELALDLTVLNPGGDLDSTRVELHRFRAVAGESPIEGSFAMSTPVSDPDIALQARGRLDLAEWNRALPLSSEGELSGLVAGEAHIEARASDVEAQRYDAIVADGTLDISQLSVRTPALPQPLGIEEGRIRLTPQFAEVPTLRGTLGSSDVALTGRIDNPLGFALRDEVLSGTADIRSSFFDLDEWRSDDEANLIMVPDRVDLTLTAAVDRLGYGNLDLRNARGSVQVRDRRATLEDFVLELFGGSLAVDGFYETIDPERPAFDVGLRLANIDVGQAGAGLNTMRAFAPIVEYARGRMTTDVRLSGVLGEDMAPVLEVLSGEGSLETAGLSLQGFPALERLAESLRTEALRQPTLSDIQASFQILDGRLHVRPFDVQLGQFNTRIAGSQGIDRTMDYALELEVPRALLGAGANQAIASLAERVPGALAALSAAEEVTLAARLTGTVSDPSVGLSLQAVDAGEALQAAVGQGVERGLQEMEARADSVASAARQRAEEEAARILAEAERQAEAIRTEAQALADATRRQGYEQADALAAREGSALERRLAQAGADRLRAESDQRAEDIVQAANTRADGLLQTARERIEALGVAPEMVPAAESRDTVAAGSESN